MQNPLNTNIKTPAFNWLKSQNSEFAAQLQKLDIDAISDFTLVWSYFENKVLGTKASCEKISDVTKSWQSNKHLEISKFETNLNYFKNRYFEDGEFTNLFNKLKLNEKAKNHEQSVQAVLDGREVKPEKCVAALLIVIYRLRCNLFHGTKWGDGIKDQAENFIHATQALMAACETHSATIKNS